ncbi:MAG: nucleolar RNA-binding Nop10p family protein, partial [Nanoarchaeota archaeon]
MSEILRCEKCLEYTLNEKCNKCGSKAVSPRPAKYSPLDKWGEWRR